MPQLILMVLKAKLHLASASASAGGDALFLPVSFEKESDSLAAGPCPVLCTL